MNNATLGIDMIVMAAGEARLAAYIEQTFPPQVANLGHYTVDNAADWLDVDDFTRWLSKPQRSSPATALRNTTSSRAVQPGPREARAPLRPPSASPIPYVLGFALTPSQMRTVALTWLEPEILAQCTNDHDYHYQLVEFVCAMNEEWAFLRTLDDESDAECYLWVVHVVPSWDGRNPRPVLSQKTVQRVKDAFRFENVTTLCQRWPMGVPAPEWLFPCMYKTIQTEERA
ncbi:hypothetical protein C8R44DRAFT_980006 [Mycena epipterygia]|nr:hypothetical protein C8R44DRAFT_980006 [Mycena epipterygia]